MKTKRLLLLTILWLPIATLLAAQPLDTVLARVELQHPRLAAYRYQAAALDTMARGARSWMPPQVEFGLWNTPYDFLRKAQPAQMDPATGAMTDPEMDRDRGMAMLQVTQMVPNFRRQRLEERFQQSRSSVVRARGQDARVQLLGEAARMYVELALTRQKLAVLADNRAVVDYLLRLTRERITYNQARLADVYRLEADLAELAQDSVEMAGMAAQADAQLRVMMRMPDNPPLQPEGMLAPRYIAREQLPPLANELAERRFDVKAMDEQVRTMELQQEAVQARRGPEFGVTVGHMQSINPNMPNAFMLMGMVTIPVAPWSRRMYESERAGLQQEVRQMQAQREDMLLMAESRARQIAVQLQAAYEQYDQYGRDLIPALERAYRAQVAQYAENAGSIDQVLDLVQRWQMARMKQLNLLQTILIQEVAYDRELARF